MNTEQAKRRRLQGVVTSTAPKDTAVVRVDRRVADSKYGKYVTVSKKFMTHDPGHVAHKGDLVEFEECRPISRHKAWRLLSVITPAKAA